MPVKRPRTPPKRSQAEIAKAVRAKSPTTKLGANGNDTWPHSDPAGVEPNFEDRAALIHPYNFRSQKELNRLTLICLEGQGLAAFDRGGAEDVRVYVHRNPKA